MQKDIDNPLLQYAEAPEPPKAFNCDIWDCKNVIHVGEKYIDDRDNSGRKFCMECGALFGKNGIERIAGDEDVW